MKNCPRCNAQMEDNAVFCQNCGFSVAQQAEPQAQQPQYNQYAAAPAPVVDQYDHTAEFSAEDVSENKLLAAVIYVSSILGIIVALIAQSSRKSKYLDFHIKQGLKSFVVMFFLGVIGAVLSWTCILRLRQLFVRLSFLFAIISVFSSHLPTSQSKFRLFAASVFLNDLT